MKLDEANINAVTEAAVLQQEAAEDVRSPVSRTLDERREVVERFISRRDDLQDAVAKAKEQLAEEEPEPTPEPGPEEGPEEG